jgi:signal transduction histidine kinase
MPTHPKSSKRVKKQPADCEGARGALSANRAEKYRERLAALFADIERLNRDPACAAPEIRHELDALRARLFELQAQVFEGKETAAPPVRDLQASRVADVQKPPAAPILYEHEQIGFAYTEERLQQIRDTGALTNLPPAISVPLMAGDQTIGNVQLTAPSERSWAPEETEVVNAVAQQVSLQIQNLRLLAETERARAEAEAATRRFMHEGWSSYLDAIHQNERIGYSYDQASVSPFSEKFKPDGGVQESVSVRDEQVGALYLKPDPARPLTDYDKQVISAIAAQIAQQVENIRLLADASRARAEADDVIKRVTREGWESFTARKENESLGFAFDSLQVTPFGDPLPEDIALSLPLDVRGEKIGQLAIKGPVQLSPEKAELAAAIAAQTSTHLETLRLTEELQQRAAELLELDRLKSGFLANMSHELRTPLNSILGFADVMLEALDGPLTPNMDMDLRLIQKNGQHLLHLINDVLDMAKIEAGRMNLDPEKFRIQEILEEVTSITSTLASEKNLALFIEADSDQAIEIVADRTRMRQVMINLVNNAIKFTEKGRIAIHVAKKADAHILIAVKDTGIGIPPDKLEVIFQEFTQVDTSSTRKAGGTGLGLPISRRLVAMHGGRLWAESTGVPGEGSTFFVELPVVARITDVIEKKER